MKNYQQKNTTTSGKLIKAVYASYVYVYCTSWSGRLEYNSVFVGLGGLGCEGAMSEKFDWNIGVSFPQYFSLRPGVQPAFYPNDT